MRNTFPFTSPRPRPRLRLYFFHAILITSLLSNEDGTTTPVTTALSHWGFLAQTVSPQALTALLHFSREPCKLRSREIQASQFESSATAVVLGELSFQAPGCFSKTQMPGYDIFQSLLFEDNVKGGTQPVEQLDGRSVGGIRPCLVAF